jgi:hypothetical protein
LTREQRAPAGSGSGWTWVGRSTSSIPWRRDQRPLTPLASDAKVRAPFLELAGPHRGRLKDSKTGPSCLLCRPLENPAQDPETAAARPRRTWAALPSSAVR